MELSFSEILLIVAIALVVMGPKELVKTSHQIGLWVGKIRTQVNNMKIMLTEEVLEDEKRELRELADSITTVTKEKITIETTTVERKDAPPHG